MERPGNLVEVYPPASLSRWGLPSKGYKTAKGRTLLSSKVSKMVKYNLFAGPWLRLDGRFDICRNEPDAFEAVIASLSARAVALERAIKPRNELQREATAAEGWT
jgi:hypothetical protein